MKAHLINCTYCQHRKVMRDPKTKNHQMEVCNITYRKLPSTREPGRFCEHFHQEGHDCESCWSV